MSARLAVPTKAQASSSVMTAAETVAGSHRSDDDLDSSGHGKDG
jgi:hypothetical protein